MGKIVYYRLLNQPNLLYRIVSILSQIQFFFLYILFAHRETVPRFLQSYKLEEDRLKQFWRGGAGIGFDFAVEFRFRQLYGHYFESKLGQRR